SDASGGLLQIRLRGGCRGPLSRQPDVFVQFRSEQEVALEGESAAQERRHRVVLLRVDVEKGLLAHPKDAVGGLIRRPSKVPAIVYGKGPSPDADDLEAIRRMLSVRLLRI